LNICLPRWLLRASVVALLEAFADAMDNALARHDNAPAQLVRWGDWLVMAATLAHLRSRLLPAGTPEAEAAVDEAEALRRQLLSRTQMQAAAAPARTRHQTRPVQVLPLHGPIGGLSVKV
jgi:segregation and condensation protein A